MSKKIALAGFAAFLSFNVNATDTIYEEQLPLVWSSIITLSGGPSWGTAGQNQYLYPTPPLPFYNYYTYNSPNSTMANAEIFFGLQRIIQPGITGELGLGVAASSDAKVTGMVDFNGIPDIFSYNYKVNHARVELKGKLIGNTFQPVQPYISGSFGAGFNNAHNYQAYSVNQFLFPAPWFASNTTIAFSYTVGAGVQTMLGRNWQVGVGYEFADLGKSYLGGDGVYLTKGPLLTHFYTNEVLFSLSYLFC